jgi:hypothetical protein
MSDVRRRTEPDYKLGWNSPAQLVPTSVPVAAPDPAPAPDPSPVKATVEKRHAEPELLSENLCNTAKYGGAILQIYNDLAKDHSMPEAVDIEKMVTPVTDDSIEMSCHGVFVFTTGARVEGTVTVRKNIAGDMISEWHPGALRGGVN